MHIPRTSQTVTAEIVFVLLLALLRESFPNPLNGTPPVGFAWSGKAPSP